MDNISYGLIGFSRLLEDEDDKNLFEGISKSEYNQLVDESVDGANKRVSELILHNINLVKNIINKCSEVGIRHFRLPNTFLCVNFLDLDLEGLHHYKEIEEGLKEIGALSRARAVSLSVNVDPLTSLVGTESTVNSGIKELEFFGKIFNIMGLVNNATNPIVMTLSDPEESDLTIYIDEFYDNYKRLDSQTKKRLTIQNSHKGTWSSINLFKYAHVYLFEQYEEVIPLVYNLQSDVTNPSTLNGDTVPIEVNIGAFNATWQGKVPVFCWTELDENLKTKDTLSESINDFGFFIKWECDVKGKDIAIFELLHPDNQKKISEDLINEIVGATYKKAEKNYQDYKEFNTLYNR